MSKNIKLSFCVYSRKKQKNCKKINLMNPIRSIYGAGLLSFIVPISVYILYCVSEIRDYLFLKENDFNKFTATNQRFFKKKHSCCQKRPIVIYSSRWFCRILFKKPTRWRCGAAKPLEITSFFILYK